jgi:hypothetical protein
MAARMAAMVALRKFSFAVACIARLTPFSAERTSDSVPCAHYGGRRQLSPVKSCCASTRAWTLTFFDKCAGVLTGNAASTQPGVIAKPWVLNSVPVEQRPRRAARLASTVFALQGRRQ